jgi:hypothetical protein
MNFKKYVLENETNKLKSVITQNLKESWKESDVRKTATQLR